MNRIRVESDSIELFTQLLDIYTVSNPQYFYLVQKGVEQAEETLSVISSTGTFKTGMFISVYKSALSLVNGDKSRILIDDVSKNEISKQCKPLNGIFDADYVIENVDKNRELRYYQRDAVTQLLKYGRGICISPTASGKSYMIATLINELRKNTSKIKTLQDKNYILLTVPTRQLVDQMYKDLTEYGLTGICRWTSDSGKKSNNTFTDNSCKNGFEQVIITNHAWITKEVANKNKKFPLKKIGCLISDEVHTVGHGTKILKVVEKINPMIRFGFTGTLPSFIFNQWSIIGFYGMAVYSAEIKQFQDEGFLSKLDIYPIHGIIRALEGKTKLLYSIDHTKKLGDILEDGSIVDTGTAFKMENLFFDTNAEEIYAPIFNKISEIFDLNNKNLIVLFDRLEIGRALFDILTKNFPKTKVHYTDGSVDVAIRENIRSELENTNGNILVAQAVTASVGLNIKNLNGIAFCFAGKSYVRVIQSIGRVIRLKKDNSRAQLFEIYFNTRYSNQHHDEKLQILHKNYGRECFKKEIVVNI